LAAVLYKSDSIFYKEVKKLIREFAFSYRECILEGYELVTERQKKYFSVKKAYLYDRLRARPHTFVLEDWAARFFFDEYEYETNKPKELFFDDYEEFDGHLDEMIKT
jgi:hypothetical protein